ncbi:atherin-like [Schistocerca americana]|uniref:atherin-like n=1 Tax=Schistocerca americana TaxID=7009 RepID=UPI001F4F7DE7|nr:atherin-like [Schistocerca americana]
MQYVRSQQLCRDGAPPEPPQHQLQTPTSPESNETPERRNLKSILKKLSAGSLFSAVPPPAAAAAAGDDSAAARTSAPAAPAAVGGPGDEAPPAGAAPGAQTVCSPTAAAKQRQVDMRKLMRAPTVEGYAARHSKLTKSVTFNRDTLQSPPASPPASPVASQQPPAQTGPTSPTTTAEDNRLITPPPPVIAQKKPQPPASVLAANQKNFLGTSLLLPSQNGDEEFFGDIISGIKQVIQGHLEDIQNKFQSRFQSLELEVKRRDEIIQQLQKRIHELENPPQGDAESHPLVPNGGEESSSDQSDADDQPFMRGDSVDTVLGSPETARPRARHDQAPPAPGRCRPRPPSWDEVSREERVELGVLPPPVPLPLPLPPAPKKPSWRQESISVDLGSSSEDSSESSSSGAEEEGFDQRAGVSWEVQMLAREMERQEQEQQRITNSELNMLQRLVDEQHPEVPASMSGMRAQSFEYPPHQQRMPLRAQLSTNGCPYDGSAQQTPLCSTDTTLSSLPPVPPRGQPYVPSDT